MLKALGMLLVLFSLPVQGETAYFAGGCFWCVEAAYQDEPGVNDVVSGFTGGSLANPTYAGNHRGHFEAVRVSFDPEVISYQQLLDIFWHNIDPFDDRGQFCDKGPSYRSALFPTNDAQWEAARESLAMIAARFPDQTIATEIRDPTRFWPVEAYHQDYYRKNPIRYRLYKTGCRRDARLREIWGDDAGGH